MFSKGIAGGFIKYKITKSPAKSEGFCYFILETEIADIGRSFELSR